MHSLRAALDESDVHRLFVDHEEEPLLNSPVRRGDSQRPSHLLIRLRL